MKPKLILREFGPAILSILIALATGIAWIGTPLRLVSVLTLLGLGMAAGALLVRAILLARQERGNKPGPKE